MSDLENQNVDYQKLYFAQFRSVDEMEELSDDLMKQIKPSLRARFLDRDNREADEFYGATSELKTFGELRKNREFLDRPLLKKAVDFFKEVKQEIDMGGSFEKARIEITDNKNAIFQFGLASKGLYRPQEFYSEELAEDYPSEFAYLGLDEGIIPLEFIKEERIKGVPYYYYDKVYDNGEVRRYNAVQQQMGTQAIKLGKKDAKLIFRSRTKKAYVKYERRGGTKPFVDVIIPVAVNADAKRATMLAKAMPTMMLADKLNEAGIKVRISVSVPINTRHDNSYFLYMFPIKDYGDKFDFQKIAYFAADPSYFRVRAFEQLQSFTASGHFKDESGKPLRRESYFGNMGAIDDDSTYRGMFLRYLNWLDQQNDNELYRDLSNADRTLVFSGFPKVYGDDLSDSRIKSSILESFYEMLDQAEFQFADVPKVVDRVAERMKEEQGDKFDYKTLKRYILNALTRSYGYAIGGQYSTDLSLQNRLEQDFERKVSELSRYLEKKGYEG